MSMVSELGRRRTRTWRLPLLVALSVAIVGGVVSIVARDDSASDPFANGGTAKFAMTVAGPGSPNSASLLRGAVDFSQNRGYIGAGTSSNRPTTNAFMWNAGGSYQAVWTDDVGSLAPTSVKWLRTDVNRVSAATDCASNGVRKLSAAAFAELGYLTPVHTVEQLRSLGTLPYTNGSRTLSGVSTTRWDTRRTVKVFDRSCKVVSTEYLFTAFVDRDGRARRIGMSIQRHDPTAHFTETFDFSDFGTPVRVETPAPATTWDVTDSMIAKSRGVGKVIDGWKPLAADAAQSPRWNAWWAVTTTGWRCYDLRAPHINVGQRSSVSNPMHNGRTTDCESLYAQSRSDQVGILEHSNNLRRLVRPAPTLLFAAPGYDRATFFLTDGTNETLNVDSASRAIVWPDDRHGQISRIVVKGPAGDIACDEMGRTSNPVLALNPVVTCHRADKPTP